MLECSAAPSTISGRGHDALRTGPVAATFARLHHLDEYLAAEVGRPEGDGWYALDTVVDDGHLDAWLESLVANNGGQRDVAGAYLGSWLAGALVSVPVSALVLERRVPHLGAGVWVHRHSDGWFDRVALRLGRGGRPGRRPRGRPSRHRGVRQPGGAVRPLRPGLGRGAVPAAVGRAPASLLRCARPVGSSGRRRHRNRPRRGSQRRHRRILRLGRGQTILDRVATRQEHLRRRPTPFPVSWSGGEAVFQVKGTCCLYYKTQDGPLDPDGDCYCTTCPFRYDDHRLARLRRHLEGETP